MDITILGIESSCDDTSAAVIRNNVLLSAVVEAENITVSDEEVEAEIQKLAEQYSMEADKVRAAVGVESLKADLAPRKAVALIKDSAVATAVPETAEKTEE